jgi:branched-chain amino acid aminotransferase
VTGQVWLNGRLVAAAEARIDPADRGLLLGDGLFETIRARSGEALHLPLHLARLRDGATVLDIALPWRDAEIEGAIALLLAAEALQDGALRVTLTRGPAARGLLPPAHASPTLLIAAAAIPPPRAARAIVATVTCRNERSPLARLKTLNYLDGILARQEAAALGADEAILLNTRGLVAETTVGNLFLLCNGIALTPPIFDGALPGIARALLLRAGLAAEASLPAGALETTGAAFISSSLGVRPVASIGARALAPPEPAFLVALRRALRHPDEG